MSWHKLTLKVIDVLALLGHRCLGTHQLVIKRNAFDQEGGYHGRTTNGKRRVKVKD